jgi:hypothetical protein
LRFWYKAGFDKIVGVVGDEVINENTFASIILERNLG